MRAIAAHVEDERRVVDFGQVGGVELRAEGDQRDAGGFGELFQLLVGETERVSEGDGLGAGSGQAGGFQFSERGAEDSLHLRDALEEAADAGGSQLRSKGQGERVAVAGGGSGDVRHKETASRITSSNNKDRGVADCGGRVTGKYESGSEYKFKSKGNYPTQAKGRLEWAPPGAAA